MWGVVFRIAAAAAAIAVVQHHVTQVYEAWRADDEANAARREAGPTKRLEEGPRANANDDDATPPASGPAAPRADGGRGGAGAPRAFAVAALSAASTRPGAAAHGGARGAVDPRSVRSALNAARRVLR